MKVTRLARVMVPVSDLDAAISFYTEVVGLSVVSDEAYGEGERWVEVAPPGGTALGLTLPRGEFVPGRRTAVSLVSADLERDHAELEAGGADVDPIMGGAGPTPRFFFLRDPDGNQMMVVDG